MNKEEIQQLETPHEDESWNKQKDELSDRIFGKAFELVLKDLKEHPELYYIRTDGKSRFAEILRRADNNIIYHTDSLAEIGLLEDAGLEK